MQILVSGAAGSIGQAIVPALTAAGHGVTGLDLVETPGHADGGWHVADCTDADAVLDAVAAQPLDAVVHLAGNPAEASLPDSLASHVLTTAALLDAMVTHGVGRLVYASSNHAVGRTPAGELVGTDAAPRPDTYYGVSKIAAEALMQLFADRHGIDAVACRIGSFLPEPVHRRHLATWLSPDDCVRMVEAALAAPAPGFATLYGISANTRAWWDLAPGRALGYHPQDDAEAWAALLPSAPRTTSRHRWSAAPSPARGPGARRSTESASRPEPFAQSAPAPAHHRVVVPAQHRLDRPQQRCRPGDPEIHLLLEVEPRAAVRRGQQPAHPPVEVATDRGLQAADLP